MGHSINGHAQPPSTQVSGDGQVVPQAPQLFLSVVVLTQVLLNEQNVGSEVDGQAQPPSIHPSADGQALPHPPQLSGSVVVFTQVSLSGQKVGWDVTPVEPLNVAQKPEVQTNPAQQSVAR